MSYGFTVRQYIYYHVLFGKLLPFLSEISQNSKILILITYISRTPNFTKIEEYVQSIIRNSFALCGFQGADFKDTHMSETLQTAPVPNFTEIRQKYGPYSNISFTPLGIK